MARPRTQRSPEATDGIAAAGVDHAALESAGAAASELSRNVALVDRQFSIDIAYNLDVYIAAIHHRAAESASRMIEMGCLLIQIRERETREVFATALDRIGLPPRFAQRAMQAAFKLQDRRAIQALGVSKALELLSEDDDTLDDLEAGGTLAGLTLDKIERMSVRELKRTLRAERAEREDEKAADEEIIRNKDERINKLSRRATRSSQREQVAGLLNDLDQYTVECATNLKHLRDTARAIDSVYADAGLQADEEVTQRIENDLNLVAEWLRQIETDLGE